MLRGSGAVPSNAGASVTMCSGAICAADLGSHCQNRRFCILWFDIAKERVCSGKPPVREIRTPGFTWGAGYKGNRDPALPTTGSTTIFS